MRKPHVQRDFADEEALGLFERGYDEEESLLAREYLEGLFAREFEDELWAREMVDELWERSEHHHRPGRPLPPTPTTTRTRRPLPPTPTAAQHRGH